MVDTASVIVICAMDSEAVHLRRRLVESVELPLQRWRRTRGKIGSVTIDIVISGIGLVFAGAATTAALIDGRPRAVINYGCSGAHQADINCGDVVLGDRVIHLTSYVVEPDGNQRPVGFRVRDGNALVQMESLPADQALLLAARIAAKNIELDRWPGLDHDPVAHIGAVGSADVWTQHAESINRLHSVHGSLCEEMEAAAIAQVCQFFETPFLAVKDISNNELQALTDLSAEGLVLAHVEEEVGRRAAAVVEQIITYQFGD